MNCKVATLALLTAGAMMSGCSVIPTIIAGAYATSGDSDSDIKAQTFKSCSQLDNQQTCIEKADKAFNYCDENAGLEIMNCYKSVHNDVRKILIDNCEKQNSPDKETCLKQVPAAQVKDE
jgi:hypothetical protein